jgi:hypothetical protein
MKRRYDMAEQVKRKKQEEMDKQTFGMGKIKNQQYAGQK